MKLYASDWDDSVDWASTAFFWFLGIMFVGCLSLIVHQCLPSKPTDTIVLFRGIAFKRLDKNGTCTYSVHLGGTRNESRSGTGVGIASTRKSVGVVPVVTSYQVAVSNDVKVWTNETKIRALLNQAMLNDERITIECRYWDRDGGYEAIKISR